MNKAWGQTMFFKIPRQDAKATRIVANIWESLSKPGQTGLFNKYTQAHTFGTVILTSNQQILIRQFGAEA